MYLLPFKIYNDISLQISIFRSHIKYASKESNGYQSCIIFSWNPHAATEQNLYVGSIIFWVPNSFMSV